MEESKATLNAGDVCLDCQQKGLETHLRYFKINLHGDTILKCESSECMYPYDNELCISDDDDKSSDNVSQTNSLKLINDLIQQFDYEEQVQDTLNHVPVDDTVTDPISQFDITFLDDLNATDNENLFKSELNDTIVTNQYESLPEINSIDYSISCKTDQNFQLPCLNVNDGTFKNFSVSIELPFSDGVKDNKDKISIQSIETIMYNELPTTSLKNLPVTSETPNLFTPAATLDQQKRYSPPLKNKQKANEIETQTTKNNSSHSKTSKTPDALKRTAKKSQLFDIPKADILKGNAILKQFVMTKSNDQTPKINRRCKTGRSKTFKQKAHIEQINQPEPPSSNNDSNYSFDKIAKMLIAKNESNQ